MYWVTVFNELAANKGVNMKQVAEEAGIKYPTLHKNVSLNTPIKIDMLAKLAEYFGVSVDYFVSPEAKLLNEPGGTYRRMNESERLEKLEKDFVKLEKRLSEIEKNISTG